MLKIIYVDDVERERKRFRQGAIIYFGGIPLMIVIVCLLMHYCGC